MDTFPNLGLTTICVVVVASMYLYSLWIAKPSIRLHDSFPIYGRKNVLFSTIRLWYRGLIAGPQLVKDGYHEHNKKGQPFLSLDHALRPHVLLPQEYIGWLVAQPSSLLYNHAVLKEKFAAHYFLPVVNPRFEALQAETLRRESQRNIGQLQRQLFNEMRDSIDATWGMNETSWREICLFASMESIIYQTINLLLIGLPLSRNQKYVRASQAFAAWFFTSAAFLGQYTPKVLRPLLAPLVGIPYRMYRGRCLKMLRPLIEERFDYFARKKKDPSLVKNEPNDMITWLARAVTDSPVSGTIAYEEVAIHYMFLSIAAIQTSMASSTHFFLDLMSSPPELGYYERIREEAAAVFKTEEDWGSSASVTKLTLVDSALRESLRKNVQLTRGLMREVMPKDGINLPDGRNLPQGTWLGIAVQGVHSDNRFYSNPDKFEPFRFAKMDPVSTETQKTPITGNDGINTGKGSSERKNVQLSTTSDIFLGFGYGRTACPGRWTAAHILKMMVAYLALNYDIQPLDNRPLNSVFGDVVLPPWSATIKVRRRKVVGESRCHPSSSAKEN